MTSAREVLAAVGAVHEAALEPAGWPVALGALCSVLRSTAMNLVVVDDRAFPGAAVAHHGFDPELVRLYNEYYVRVDPVHQAGRRLDTGGVVCSNQLMPDSHWEATELYADMCRPYDIFYLLGGALEVRPPRIVGLGILRPRSAGPFDDHDLELYHLLMPHVATACRVQSELLRARGLAAGLASTLDQLAVGAVLLDDRDRVVHVNRAAESILAASSALQVAGGELTAVSAAAAAPLRRLLGEAVMTGRGIGLSPGGAVRIARAEPAQPLTVLVSPLAASGLSALGYRAAAVAFIFDPDSGPRDPGELLRALYGLTAAEARLASLLAEGASLAEIADCLEVSQTTLKTHLRAVFAKTGARRQAELVTLLLRGPYGALAGSNGNPAH
ncbi:MAG TPA: helix-turn-helix transcriptional regulator [Methylomirabilota bacterium]|nr:helix-turn-helix transcriptional regulator [Methylomirabilota bacterium]